MLKRIFLFGLLAVAFSFAEGTYIRNICDTLPASATPKVELKLAFAEEAQWFGAKDFSKTDSSTAIRYKGYEDLKPFRGQFPVKLPVSITAACAETKNNLFKYAQWDGTEEKWVLDDTNDDYATYIMDVNMVEFPGYDAENSYNFLAMKKNMLPADGAYSSGEILVSRTFEFQFDWWYVMAAYKIVTTTDVEEEGKTVTYEMTSWKTGTSFAMDSASAVDHAVKALKLTDSDTVSKIQFTLFHVVLMDANKIPPDEVLFSSSSIESSSSVASSSSDQASSSSDVTSSGSENVSSSSLDVSSSSESTTLTGRMESSPRAFDKAVEIRRLDGSVVKSRETLVPGVYYVKGIDGLWKKRLELP